MGQTLSFDSSCSNISYIKLCESQQKVVGTSVVEVDDLKLI